MNEEVLSLWRSIMEKGTQCLGKEQLEAAENYFSQSILLAEKIQVAEILAFSIRLLATTRVKLGKFELAEAGFQQALKICQELHNAKGMSEALGGLASVALAKGELRSAVQLFEASLEIYPSSSPPIRKGMLYSDLGHAYVALENWPKAKEAYKKAKDLCQVHGYFKGEAELDVLLGEVFYRQGNKEEARKWIREACQIFVKINDPVALFSALQYLAFLYFDQDEMQAALECQLRVVALALRHVKGQEASESCYFLSKIEQSMGQYGEAELYLKMSIELYAYKDIGLALRYQSLATLALTSIDFSKAEEYYLEAAKIFELLHEEIKLGEVYEALAFLLEVQGKEDEALVYHLKSVGKFADRGVMAIEAIQTLAEFFEYRRQNYVEALKYYWQALQLAREFNSDAQPQDQAIQTIEKSIQRISKKLRQKNKNKL